MSSTDIVGTLLLEALYGNATPKIRSILYMYACIYTYTYIHIYIYIYVCIYVYMYVRLYVRTCVEESSSSSKQSRKRLFACAESAASAADDEKLAQDNTRDIILVHNVPVTCKNADLPTEG